VKMISEASFSVYPSEWYENYPYSVVESLMYGTPVVGANIGGIPEIIENGYNGLLFKIASEDDLIEKILALWNNRGLLEKMTQNCLKTEFDTPESHGRKLLDLYRQIMKQEEEN